MPWRCRNCGLVQSKDIGDCRNCGHTEAEQVSQDELNESIEGIDRPEPMRFDGGPSASTAKKTDSSVWKAPDVNLDGSIADDGVETPEPVSRSWWESFSLEKWWIKLTGNVRFAVQVVGVALVLLTGYNLLAYPSVGIEIWFGYRDIFVQALAAEGGNEFGLYAISDIIFMVGGMIAAWFA